MKRDQDIPHITKAQKKVLDFINEYTLQNGSEPTIREIGEGLGLSSPATVHMHLRALEKNGFLRKDEKHVKSQYASKRYRDAGISKIPLVGRVAAGIPILAEENIQEYISISSDRLPTGDLFMLQVQGESMINAGIFDKDIIIVKQTSTAEEGDIVVALIDDSATVKRFHRDGKHIVLMPENPAFYPIVADQVEILGCVVGVFRVFNK